MTTGIAGFVLHVLLALVVLGPHAQKQSERDRLVAAVRAVRVGDQAQVADSLDELSRSKTRDVRAAAAWLAARVHAARGEGKLARKAFELARPFHDVLPRATTWLRVEVLAAEEQYGKALEALEALAREHPDFRRDARDLLFSRLVERAGDLEEASRVSLALATEGRLGLPNDELLARAARTTADPLRARELWLAVRLRFPDSELDAEAAAKVADAELTLDERRARVQRLFEHRAYEACRREAKALWDDPSAGLGAAGTVVREEVGYFLGKIGSERLRDDVEGAVGFLDVARGEAAPFAPEAAGSYAIALAKLGRTGEAVAAFDAWAQRFGADVPAARRIEVAYDRGVALHRAGRSREAAESLQAALEADPTGYDGPKYRWFVGWWRYRADDLGGALAVFDELAPRPNPLEGGKARYWKGRALDRLERRGDAVAVLSALAREQPLTYYGALAARQLEAWKTPASAKKATADKAQLDGMPDWSRLAAPPRDPLAGLRASASRTRLERALLLAEPDTARVVWREVRPRLIQENGAVRVQRLEGDLADALERFASAREAAWKTDGKRLGSAPTRETLAAWRAIYPQAYRTHVEAAAARENIPTALVYAHMLQESRYFPRLISAAPAYGLLELLPRTAVRLARDAGESYALPQLVEPRWNIRWGVRYLGALVKKFHGQLPFAIASYNGGPMLLERYLGSAKDVPFDVVIEDLATHESRNYVRKVIEHALRYLALYEQPKTRRALERTLVPMAWTAGFEKEPSF